jgi:hypothetical protein
MGRRAGRIIAPVLVPVLAVALSACTGGQVTSPSASISSSVPPLSTTSTSSSSASVSASPVSGHTASCKDSSADAEIDAGEVRRVVLEHQGDALKVTFKLADSFPETGTFTVLLSVTNTDGSASRQLGAKWLDGELIAYFVFDSAEAQQQNLDGQPVVDGKVVTALFPWDAVSDLGAVWNWSATTTVEGEDADYCPEPGAELLNPKKARFPSS